MKGKKIPWDIILIGVGAGILVNVPPLEGWLETLSARTWVGLPWVLLAALWLGIGVWALVDHNRGSNRSAPQE